MSDKSNGKDMVAGDPSDIVDETLPVAESEERSAANPRLQNTSEFFAVMEDPAIIESEEQMQFLSDFLKEEESQRDEGDSDVEDEADGVEVGLGENAGFSDDGLTEESESDEEDDLAEFEDLEIPFPEDKEMTSSDMEDFDPISEAVGEAAAGAGEFERVGEFAQEEPARDDAMSAKEAFGSDRADEFRDESRAAGVAETPHEQFADGQVAMESPSISDFGMRGVDETVSSSGGHEAAAVSKVVDEQLREFEEYAGEGDSRGAVAAGESPLSEQPTVMMPPESVENDDRLSLDGQPIIEDAGVPNGNSSAFQPTAIMPQVPATGSDNAATSEQPRQTSGQSSGCLGRRTFASGKLQDAMQRWKRGYDDHDVYELGFGVVKRLSEMYGQSDDSELKEISETLRDYCDWQDGSFYDLWETIGHNRASEIAGGIQDAFADAWRRIGERMLGDQQLRSDGKLQTRDENGDIAVPKGSGPISAVERAVHGYDSWQLRHMSVSEPARIAVLLRELSRSAHGCPAGYPETPKLAEVRESWPDDTWCNAFVRTTFVGEAGNRTNKQMGLDFAAWTQDCLTASNALLLMSASLDPDDRVARALKYGTEEHRRLVVEKGRAAWAWVGMHVMNLWD